MKKIIISTIAFTTILILSFSADARIMDLPNQQATTVRARTSLLNMTMNRSAMSFIFRNNK